MRPAPEPFQRDFLALAVFSSAVLLGAISAACYDTPLVIGVSLLSIATPTLYLFSQWNPEPEHYVSNTAWFLCAPCAFLGITFVLIHVQILCGLLFAATTLVAFFRFSRAAREKADSLLRQNQP